MCIRFPSAILVYQPSLCPVHDGISEQHIRVVASEDDSAVFWHLDELKSSHEQRRGLAAASRAAIQSFKVKQQQELSLFWRWSLRDVRVVQDCFRQIPCCC